jgi:hypothetical protein
MTIFSVNSASINTLAVTNAITAGNIITSGSLTTSGSQFSGIVSGSGTQYRLVVPVGTNLYAT